MISQFFHFQNLIYTSFDFRTLGFSPLFREDIVFLFSFRYSMTNKNIIFAISFLVIEKYNFTNSLFLMYVETEVFQNK